MDLDTLITQVQTRFNIHVSDNTNLITQLCLLNEQLHLMQHIYEHFLLYQMCQHENNIVVKCLITPETKKIWGVTEISESYMLSEKKHHCHAVIDTILLKDVDITVYKNVAGIKYLRDLLTNYMYYRVIVIPADSFIRVVRMDSVISTFITLYIDQLVNSQLNLSIVITQLVSTSMCEKDREFVMDMYHSKLRVLIGHLRLLQISPVELEIFEDIMLLKAPHRHMFNRLFRQYVLNIGSRNNLGIVRLYVNDIALNINKVSSRHSGVDFTTPCLDKLEQMNCAMFTSYSFKSIRDQKSLVQKDYNNTIFSYNLYAYIINCGLTVPSPSTDDKYLIDTICDPQYYRLYTSNTHENTVCVDVLMDNLNCIMDYYLSVFYESLQQFVTLEILHQALFF